MKLTFAVILTAICAISFAQSQSSKVKVLIVDGYSNHDWELTTRVIQAVLAKDGRFEVAVSTVPATLTAALEAWEPNFKNYDVVLQTANDINRAGPAWPPKVQRELEDYVKGGGGLFIYHSANNAFASWVEYNKMIGLGWRDASFGEAITVNEDGTYNRIAAGEGPKSSHGPRVDVLVNSVNDHPIHKGLPKQFMVADVEVYTNVRGPVENLTVLSYAKDVKFGQNQPMEWVVKYGEGNVYTSVFGHIWPREGVQPSARCAAYQTLMVRALLWLANRPVDETAPADFPTAEKISIRPSPIPGEEKGPVGYTSTRGHEAAVN